MSERQGARYLRDLLAALAYCHAMGIIHRDIKPDNLLFLTRRSESALKVIDFGLSDFMYRIRAQAGPSRTESPLLVCDQMPPERGNAK